MARPRSEERRSAILAAATRVIAAQGLGAATATIAQEADVSNGSLFTYFATKADLMNQVYVVLKTEMAAVALDGLPTASDVHGQMLFVWTHWLRWATSCHEKRRTLAQLDVSEMITVESHQVARQALADVRALLERSCARGPLRDASLEFTVALMVALANATIDAMIRDPANADAYCMTAFDALWRMIT